MAENFQISVDDRAVREALGSLQDKAPAVLKVAINRTARETRRDLIAEARKRYALNARGVARLQLLAIRKQASNSDLRAIIRQSDEGLPLNASYFQHSPTNPFMGRAAFSAPSYQHVRTLRGGAMKPLRAEAGTSKGFLIDVTNSKSSTNHLMFAHRILGSSSERNKTNTGKSRWRSRLGTVEKAHDVERIGASSQERAIWNRGGQERCTDCLERHSMQRLQQVIEMTARRAKAKR